MNTISKSVLLLLAPLALGTQGCVSSATYDAAVAGQARAETALASERRAEASARVELATIQAEEERLALQLTGRKVTGAVLATRLWITRAQRDYLLRAYASAERRAAATQEVATRLRRMIDTGDVQVIVRDGRMVVVLANDVLFESGHVDVKPSGHESLALVAGALRTLSGRHFQVAGHTDDLPISSARFPSNWELSNGRAVEVVRLLMKEGIEPASLSAAGYAEFDPIVANDSAKNRAKNRRIEITLTPEVDELPPR